MKRYWQVTIMPMMAVLFGLFFIGSCLPLPMQTGIGTFNKDEKTGAMSKDYPKSMQETWDAVLSSAKKMQVNISNQKFDPKECLLEGVQSSSFLFIKADTNVKVELLCQGDQSSTVKVRFGPKDKPADIFTEGGMQEMQKEFHGHIMDSLKIPRSTEFMFIPLIL